MRIYLSGSHSAGKSTLARYISEQYALPMISEVARTVLSEKELQVDILRADLATVNSYQSEVFYRQIEEESKYTDFVSDRSLIDCLSYSIVHSNISQNLMQDELYQKYINQLKQTNALVFFICPSKAIMKSDGVRETLNYEGMIEISSIIKALYKINNIRYFQINMDSIQERIHLIDNIIELAGKA